MSTIVDVNKIIIDQNKNSNMENLKVIRLPKNFTRFFN